MLSLAKRAVRKCFRACGYDVVAFAPDAGNGEDAGPRYPADYSGADVQTLDQALPFTMTGPHRLWSMIGATRYVVARGVQGAIVECGVWRGGSMMASALTLKHLEAADRELYLYDTFEGMSEPTDEDVHEQGRVAKDKFSQTQKESGGSDWCYASLEEVQHNMAQTGYDPKLVHYVKGKIEDTVPGQLPDQIAILRLDTDWYESTRHELTHMYPRLVSGGVLIVDDYFDWKGQKKAVDEYFAEHGIQLLMHRIDQSARVAVKH